VNQPVSHRQGRFTRSSGQIDSHWRCTTTGAKPISFTAMNPTINTSSRVVSTIGSTAATLG
jgi:hypothetical protein